MPRTLVVPGVSVEARFDVPPPLPARSGILGAVGVVDRVPPGGVQAVTTTQELLDLFGPATRLSFPEALSALVNGVSELVLSPVKPDTGQAAQVRLLDDASGAVAILRARAAGPWGNDLSVRVTRSVSSDRRTIRSITLEVLHKGVSLERHDNLVFRPGEARDFFTAINRDSGVIVAVDPVFEADLPAFDGEPAHLTENNVSAATGTLTSGGTALVRVTAKNPGAGGNFINLRAQAGHAVAVLNDTSNPPQPAVRIRALTAGRGGTEIKLSVADDGSGGVNITVKEGAKPPREYKNLTSIASVVQKLNLDPAVAADRLGNLLPAPTAAEDASLAETVTMTVMEEGARTADYADLLNSAAITAALNEDPALTAQLVGAETSLPEITAANTFYLAGGLDAGWSRRYKGQHNPSQDLLEIRAVEGAAADLLRIRFQAGTESGTVRLRVGQLLLSGYEELEVHDNLSMDPDHSRYLPAVLQQASAFIRGIDLYLRAHPQWPMESRSPIPFSQGTAPALSAWQAAIDQLAGEDDVDMVLAGLQNWGDPNLNGIAVQQALVAHARAQADNAKPRIALCSIRPADNSTPSAIIVHAGQIADRRSVLVAPAGADGALAGLLGHLEYFQSPTFKTVASPGVTLQPYLESDLIKLVGPEANACVIAQRRGRGSICIKGICTDGFQISVVRVADRCIREVKKIADRFIGELNNDESRTALEQMIIAVFTQMARDGALVPSVDGDSPAFQVKVYASKNDVAAGNARIDVAVRPVRAIDYIYATIRVKN